MISSRSVPRGIIRDVALIAIGIMVIWLGLYAVFGMTNPFYVVASGSMIPELEVYDVLVVQSRIPFEELEIGDVIVFDRPSDHNRVIVHRIVSIIDEDPRTVRTKGDANRASIPGTDFPITDKEYIGKVEIVIPEVGYVTQALKPPVNYIIIVVIIGIMIGKQLIERKRRDDENAMYGGNIENKGGGPEDDNANSNEDSARDMRVNADDTPDNNTDVYTQSTNDADDAYTKHVPEDESKKQPPDT